MNARKIIFALMEWSLGLAAAVTAASLLRVPVLKGHLTNLGWTLLLLSSALFVMLLVRLATVRSGDEKRHRQILSSTELAKDPGAFIRVAPESMLIYWLNAGALRILTTRPIPRPVPGWEPVPAF